MLAKATSTDRALEEWDKATANTLWGLDIYVYPGSLSSDRRQETAIGHHFYRFHANARNTYSSDIEHGIHVEADTLEECIDRILAYMKSMPREVFEIPGVSWRINLNEEKKTVGPHDAPFT